MWIKVCDLEACNVKFVHLSHAGFFVFISGSYYDSPLHKARLISPVIDNNSKKSCLEFWYHMFGEDVETLSVYIKPDGSSLPATPNWNITGNQWNYWHYAQFEIPKNSGKSRVSIGL